MNLVFGAGLGLTVLGLVGYAIGIAAPYPGRSFSLTGLMIGLTLAAIGRSLGSEGDGDESGNGDGEGDRSGTQNDDGEGATR